MPRLPSDVWRHFTQVDIKGKPLWTCKYCRKAYVKNATKLQLHIVKCQQFVQAARSSAPVEVQPVLFDSGTLLSTADNSGAMFDCFDHMHEHSRRNLDECFARAVYASDFPLTMASNVHWQRFFNTLRPAYSPPTAHALSTHLLDKEFERVQEKVRQTIDKAECVSLISEGWSDGRGCINYVVATPQPVFYKGTDTREQRHTGAFIAEELKGVIEEVGPGKVFALVTDTAANMEEAWAHVEQIYPHISIIGCAARCFDRFLKDVMALKSMDTLYQKATHIVKSVKGSQVASIIYASKQKQKNKSMELKLYSIARGGVVVFYERLLDGQESLQEMASSNSAEIESEVYRILLDNVFWERLSSGLSILKPIAKAIAKMEDNEAILSDVVCLFEELKEEIQTILPSSLLLQAEEAAVIESLEKQRQFCVKPLHVTAFMLDPKYNGSVLSAAEVSSTYAVISTLSGHLGLDCGRVLGSLAKYRTKQGLWRGDSIWQSCKHISACTWWNGLCASEAIAPVASIVLQIPPSAVPLLGNRRVKVHHRLSNGREEKLAAVRTNLRLFEVDAELSPVRLDSDSDEDVEGEKSDNYCWPQSDTFEEA